MTAQKIGEHDIRLSPEDSARWHSDDVKVWASARRDLRAMVVQEATNRRALVSLYDATGELVYSHMPPRLPFGARCVTLPAYVYPRQGLPRP